MNYRHGFHAGNFADLAKHAALLAFIRLWPRDGLPRWAVDTHAGAGFYDLSDPDFARSKEAEAGIKYLLDGKVPESLKPLADYVRAKNAAAGYRDRIGIYPGSPVLCLDHRTGQDRYVGCELRDDDFTLLKRRIEPQGQAIQDDGYAIAAEIAADAGDADILYLIDPPFEQPGDYAAIVDTLHAVLDVRPDARALIWLPIKDLETFDAFLRHIEREVSGVGVVVSELRLRPLTNPMKMNGCALVAVHAPDGFEDQLRRIAADVVAVFGEPGGEARTWQVV